MGKLTILGTILILFSSNVLAKNLGTLAHTFVIEEEAFTVMLKNKLALVDMEKERVKMEKVARDKVNNPTPVEGIVEAKEDRSFYHDPSYVLDEDIVLPCGKIMHKAGKRVNPLEYMDLNRRLFFIDSSKEDQIEWLKEQLETPFSAQEKVIEDRIILVGGSVFELEKELNEQSKDHVYFDQHGELTTKFKIKAVPAIAMQEGLKILINEVQLND